MHLLFLAALLTGCAAQAEKNDVPSSPVPIAKPNSAYTVAPSPDDSAFAPTETIPVEEEPFDFPIHPYLKDLVSNIVNDISLPEMTEYQRTKAAFDYMIEHTVLDEPIGLDLWRVHGGGDEPIPFLEQRAISPLRFGVGMCEDYAAALTLLLRGLGLEAQYVPGLTYSLEGHLVDHAWTMVRIDGVWYHLDSQLEDNISLRRSTVRYRYFLKSDAAFSASHLWGQRLIDSGLLTPEQNAELAKHYQVPACPQDYAAPEPHQLENAAAPDLEALRAQAQAELTAYENENGALPPLTLDTIPPIFGLEGFGPPDEG